MAHTKRHRPTWPLRRQHRRPWYFDANVRRRQPTLLLWPVLKRMKRLIKRTGGRPRSSSVRWTRQSRARATSLGTLQPLHFLMQSQARQTTSVRQMHQQMHQLHHHHHPHANMFCSNMRAVVILNGYGVSPTPIPCPMQQTAKQNALSKRARCQYASFLGPADKRCGLSEVCSNPYAHGTYRLFREGNCA